MALIKSVRGFTPKIGENCYLADNATIIGDVVIGKDCSIWFNAVLRGDVNAIRIGNRVNIQDGSVVHTADCTDAVRSITMMSSNVFVQRQSVIEKEETKS